LGRIVGGGGEVVSELRRYAQTSPLGALPQGSQPRSRGRHDLIGWCVALIHAARDAFRFTFFAAASAIYLLLRHDVDEKEMDEVSRIGWPLPDHYTRLAALGVLLMELAAREDEIEAGGLRGAERRLVHVRPECDNSRLRSGRADQRDSRRQIEPVERQIDKHHSAIGGQLIGERRRPRGDLDPRAQGLRSAEQPAGEHQVGGEKDDGHFLVTRRAGRAQR
jgi:hypothetical protein